MAVSEYAINAIQIYRHMKKATIKRGSRMKQLRKCPICKKRRSKLTYRKVDNKYKAMCFICSNKEYKKQREETAKKYTDVNLLYKMKEYYISLGDAK